MPSSCQESYRQARIDGQSSPFTIAKVWALYNNNNNNNNNNNTTFEYSAVKSIQQDTFSHTLQVENFLEEVCFNVFSEYGGGSFHPGAVFVGSFHSTGAAIAE